MTSSSALSSSSDTTFDDGKIKDSDAKQNKNVSNRCCVSDHTAGKMGGNTLNKATKSTQFLESSMLCNDSSAIEAAIETKALKIEKIESNNNSTVPNQPLSRVRGIVPKNMQKNINEDSQDKMSHNERWEDMFRRLQDFRKEHGHCVVPSRYQKDRKLAMWVSTQRRHFKKFNSGIQSACMTQERADRLSQIGFDWCGREKSSDLRWDAQFKKLLIFIEKHGHAHVPIGSQEYPLLSNWVSNQRQDYKCTNRYAVGMTEERIELLNSVGFLWDVLHTGLGRMRHALAIESNDVFECDNIDINRNSNNANMNDSNLKIDDEINNGSKAIKSLPSYSSRKYVETAKLLLGIYAQKKAANSFVSHSELVASLRNFLRKSNSGSIPLNENNEAQQQLKGKSRKRVLKHLSKIDQQPVQKQKKSRKQIRKKDSIVGESTSKDDAGGQVLQQRAGLKEGGTQLEVPLPLPVPDEMMNYLTQQQISLMLGTNLPRQHYALYQGFDPYAMNHLLHQQRHLGALIDPITNMCLFGHSFPAFSSPANPFSAFTASAFTPLPPSIQQHSFPIGACVDPSLIPQGGNDSSGGKDFTVRAECAPKGVSTMAGQFNDSNEKNRSDGEMPMPYIPELSTSSSLLSQSKESKKRKKKKKKFSKISE